MAEHGLPYKVGFTGREHSIVAGGVSAFLNGPPVTTFDPEGGDGISGAGRRVFGRTTQEAFGDALCNKGCVAARAVVDNDVHVCLLADAFSCDGFRIVDHQWLYHAVDDPVEGIGTGIGGFVAGADGSHESYNGMPARIEEGVPGSLELVFQWREPRPVGKHLADTVGGQYVEYGSSEIMFCSQFNVIPVVLRDFAEEAIQIAGEQFRSPAFVLAPVFLLEDESPEVMAQQRHRRFVKAAHKDVRIEVGRVGNEFRSASELLSENDLGYLQQDVVIGGKKTGISLEHLEGPGGFSCCIEENGVEGVIQFEYFEMIEVFADAVHGEHDLLERPASDFL